MSSPPEAYNLKAIEPRYSQAFPPFCQTLLLRTNKPSSTPQLLTQNSFTGAFTGTFSPLFCSFRQGEDRFAIFAFKALQCSQICALKSRSVSTRFGWLMRAKPKSGDMSKSGGRLIRSTHSGGPTWRNVRSARNSASRVRLSRERRRETGSAAAGLRIGLSRMRGNSHVRF
jgi:hypothetical protein